MVTSMKTPEVEPKEEAAPVEESQVEVEVTESDTAPEEQNEVDKEIPKGVRKRLGRLDEEQAYYDGLIDAKRDQVAARKKELAELDGTQGAEPAKSPKPTSEAPEEPDLDTFEGGNAEYKAAVKQWKSDYRDWLRTETSGTVRAELEAERQKAQATEARSKAVEKHGKEWEDRRQAVGKASSVGLQAAISELDAWDAVVNHLGQNPAELAELNQQFEANPVRAIRQLGKLEDRLTAATTEDAPPKPKLPPPIAPTGGKSGATRAQSLNEALDSGDVGATRRMLKAAGHLRDRARA